MQETMNMAIRLVDDRVKFVTELEGQPSITLDAHEPSGHGGGYTPLDLFLASISSCLGMAMGGMVRGRLRRTITAMEIRTEGTLLEEHPKAFRTIRMHLILTSPDATDAEVARALDSAEKKVCPVWAMVKGNVEVASTFEIIRP